MRFEFLDQIPPDSLKEWEKETLDAVRSLLESTQPGLLDIARAYVRIKRARPLKVRHLEISLPHSQDEKASLLLAEDDHEFEIDTSCGFFRWDGDRLEDVQRFLAAALRGHLELETIFRKGRPKRSRAWRVSSAEADTQLLGESHPGWGRDEVWATAVRTRPSSFL